jgi:hypothetical protein
MAGQGSIRLASAREPARSVQCAAAEIDNAIRLSRGELGYPLTEQGPCASCGAPTRLYGLQGSPTCGSCKNTGANQIRAGPLSLLKHPARSATFHGVAAGRGPRLPSKHLEVRHR